MSLTELIHSIPPPTKPTETGSPKAWEKCEARLGLSLPPDYKALIDSYGTGSFGGMITLYNPFATNPEFNLLYALDTLHQAERQTRIGVDHVWTVVNPFELYPALAGLLPWGYAESFRHMFFWRVSGPPQSWETIFYLLGSGEYEVWKIPMTELLYRLPSGSIETVLLPSNYFPKNLGFQFNPLTADR